MKPKPSLALVASGMLFALSAVSATALTIGFSPVNQTVPLGSNPQVNLIATLGGTPDLSGWDLNLNYDPAIVTLNSVVFGSWLGDNGLFQTLEFVVEAPPGTVNLSQFSLLNPLPGQPASFTLATLTFSADNLGTSPLTLALAQGGLTTGAATDITGYQLDSGSITVRDPNQVPEGGNVMIVALPTLFGLLLLSKRMRNPKH